MSAERLGAAETSAREARVRSPAWLIWKVFVRPRRLKLASRLLTAPLPPSGVKETTGASTGALRFKVLVEVAGRRFQETLLLASLFVLRTPPSHWSVVNFWVAEPRFKVVSLARLRKVAGVTACRAAAAEKLPSWARPVEVLLLRARPRAGLRRVEPVGGLRVRRAVAPRRSSTGISPLAATRPTAGAVAAEVMALLMAVTRAARLANCWAPTLAVKDLVSTPVPPLIGRVTARLRVRAELSLPLRKSWGAEERASIARPAVSPGRLMVVALRATVLLPVLVVSLLPSRIWERGERRMLLLAAVAVVAVIVRESRAIRSRRSRGDRGAVIATVGAAIQAPATTRSVWALPVPEVLPPRTRASAASRLTLRVRLAVEAGSRTMLAACRVEPRTLVVLEPERSTEPEAVALLVGLRALKAVLTVPPATRRPDEKSPWPAAVPLAVMERLPRLITPPEAVMVMVGAVMVVAPATAVAPARVRVPGVEMLRLAGVAAAANQAGPVLVESAPARIEP